MSSSSDDPCSEIKEAFDNAIEDLLTAVVARCLKSNLEAVAIASARDEGDLKTEVSEILGVCRRNVVRWAKGEIRTAEPNIDRLEMLFEDIQRRIRPSGRMSFEGARTDYEPIYYEEARPPRAARRAAGFLGAVSCRIGGPKLMLTDLMILYHTDREFTDTAAEDEGAVEKIRDIILNDLRMIARWTKRIGSDEIKRKFPGLFDHEHVSSEDVVNRPRITRIWERWGEAWNNMIDCI
jgi:hypothetical protein